MRYLLPLLVLLSGCGSTDALMGRNLATCEKMGMTGKEASECALRLFEVQNGGGTVRVTK